LRILEGHLHTRGASAAMSITAAGEESSAIRAMVECAVGDALKVFYQELSLFELQINATASRVDSNSLLRGGNADYHTGLI
jgi:hypothetical protein